MTDDTFDQAGIDVQATRVEPMAPEEFDFEAYADYESSLLERCQEFWTAESAVLVYRRMRVAEVFSYGCKDMKAPLQHCLVWHGSFTSKTWMSMLYLAINRRFV